MAFDWLSKGRGAMDESRIILKIDLHGGTIELDAPAESFDQAIAQTKDLASSLNFLPHREAERPPITEEKDSHSSSTTPSIPSLPPPRRNRPSRGTSST